ncbi:MAG: FtsW/RodA/SpoVE family cell cycle protein [Patescibacteria group bacterium]|nr:FtsW/RodA/SpoVE family cell cycle protein [Patescibacteria group bacterium]MDD4611016.1 FtsW/RodA/SpoVE family cell cycle protein [Patescibacteria group bacterium]
MIDRNIKQIKNFDWILFFSAILLAALGLVEIYSIALGQENITLINFKKQAFFILLGILLFFTFAFLDYHWLANNNKYLFFIGFFALLGVLIFGNTVRGTRGWFSLGGFNLQPVEFIKIILIIFLAKYFSSSSAKIRPLKQLIFSGLLSLIFVFLVLLQPDFGSALILVSIWLGMLLIVGFKKKYFLAIILLFVLILIPAWSFGFKDYQKERILSFVSPVFNNLKQDYNVAQAMIAVGSGGLTGRGLGFGSQSQLKFLPEAQNDFIFAVVAEELGLFGVLLVFFFFSLIFYRIIINIKRINNDFGIFFIISFLGLIFLEMFINIGMNLGILPVVGISLPFLSYGGSSIISNFILLGIVESVIIRSRVNY